MPAPETPPNVPAQGPLGAKVKAGSGFGKGTGHAKSAEKKKAKPTVATLAATVEGLVKALPLLTSHLAALDQRISDILKQGQGVPTGAAPAQPMSAPPVSAATDRSSLLRQPLSGAVPQIAKEQPYGAFLQKMRPPKACQARSFVESSGLALRRCRSWVWRGSWRIQMQMWT